MESQENGEIDISLQTFEEESRKAKLFQDEYKIFVEELRQKARGQQPSRLSILSKRIVRFIPDQPEQFHLVIETLVSDHLNGNSELGNQVASEFEKIWKINQPSELKESKINTSPIASQSKNKLMLTWKVLSYKPKGESLGKDKSIIFGFFYGIPTQKQGQYPFQQIKQDWNHDQSFRNNFRSLKNPPQKNIFSGNYIAIVECLNQGVSNFVIGVFKASKIITLSKYFLNGQKVGKIFLPKYFDSFPVSINHFRQNPAKQGFYEPLKNQQVAIVEKAFAVIELKANGNLKNYSFAVSLNLNNFDVPGKILSYQIKMLPNVANPKIINIVQRKFPENSEGQKQEQGLLIRQYSVQNNGKDKNQEKHQFSFYDSIGFEYCKNETTQWKDENWEECMNSIAIFEILEDSKDPKIIQYGIGVYYSYDKSIVTLNKYIKPRYNFTRTIGAIYLKKKAFKIQFPFEFGKKQLLQNFDQLSYLSSKVIPFSPNNIFLRISLSNDQIARQFPFKNMIIGDFEELIPSMYWSEYGNHVIEGISIGLQRYRTLEHQVLTVTKFQVNNYLSQYQPQFKASIILINPTSIQDKIYFYGFYDNIFNCGGQDYFLSKDLITPQKADSSQNESFMIDNQVKPALFANKKFPYSSLGIIKSPIQQVQFSFGTASLLCNHSGARNFLITCAHNVIDQQGNEKDKNKFYFIRKITQIQEQTCRYQVDTSDTSDQTKLIIHKLEYMKEYTKYQKENKKHNPIIVMPSFTQNEQKIEGINLKYFCDIAIIRLKQGGYPKIQGLKRGFQIQLIQKPISLLKQKVIQISGFPAEEQFGKRFGVLYKQSKANNGCFQLSRPLASHPDLRIIKHTISTQAGNSGSPFYEKISEDESTLLGIHIAGSGERLAGIEDYSPHNYAAYIYSKHIYDWLLKIKGIHTVVNGMSEMFSSIAIIQLDNQYFGLGIFKHPNKVIMLSSEKTKDIIKKKVYFKKQQIKKDQEHEILEFDLNNEEKYDVREVQEVLESNDQGFIALRLDKGRQIKDQIRLIFQGGQYDPSLIIDIQSTKDKIPRLSTSIQDKKLSLMASYFQQGQKQQGLLFSYHSQQKERFYGAFRDSVHRYNQDKK